MCLCISSKQGKHGSLIFLGKKKKDFILTLFRNKLCDKVHECHRAIARRHSAIKCVRIVATDAVPNYPARNIPTLLLYHRSDPVDQLVGPGALSQVTPDCMINFVVGSFL